MSIRVALLLAACVAVAVAQPPQGPDQCDDEYECTCLPVDGHALRLCCLVGTCSRDVGEWLFRLPTASGHFFASLSRAVGLASPSHGHPTRG
jgi:hypothetical protein